MSNRRAISVGVALLLLPTILAATTIRVPQDHSDLQAAIDAALAGDTVLVAEGVYQVNLLIEDKDIVLTSAFGHELTNLRPVNFGVPILEYRGSTTSNGIVEGFTFSHTGARDGYPYTAAAIELDDAGATVRGNAFTNLESWIGNGSAVYGTGTTDAVIERNIFYDNPGVYTVIWTRPGMIAANNSISTGRLGFNLNQLPYEVTNNTISDCERTETGTAPEYTFNNAWNIDTPPVPIDLSVDPEFIEVASGNMHLRPTSGLINQGDPASPLDPDGTRADIGAIPFDLRNASVYSLNLGDDAAHVQSGTPTFYWNFFDSTAAQAMIEIEVGTDNDWSVAELWQPGAMSSSDTSIVFAGPALSPGDIVYWRLRAFNGSIWGAWKEHVFRVNNPASAPIAIKPINQKTVSVDGVRLWVENSTSTFGDDLSYEFEVYADPGLSTLVISQTGIPEGDTITVSDLVTGLTVGAQYWWRARAHDGYQGGAWSTTETFEVRAPMALRVPAEYPTLKAAIAAATEHDTVLVAPGTYSGPDNRNLSFDGVNIAIVSESGPELTTIDLDGAADLPNWLLRVQSLEDTTSLLQGLRIINGSDSSFFSGVITVTAGALSINDCVFEDNHLTPIQTWAGNYDSIPNLIVRNSVFRQNEGSGVSMYNGNARVQGCRIDSNSIHGLSIGWPRLVTVAENIITGNDHGIHIDIYGGGELTVVNNTCYGNTTGLNFYWEPPKGGESRPAAAANLITQNIFAYNAEFGIREDGLGFGAAVTCNNAYGNGEIDFNTYDSQFDPIYPGDQFGNISAPPLFCDRFAGDFALPENSPGAPANNSCGLLMGAEGIDPTCAGHCCVGRTGNVSTDLNDEVNLTDLTLLVNSLFVTFEPLPCPAEANTSGDETCNVTLTDITILVNHLFVTFEEVALCLLQCE